MLSLKTLVVLCLLVALQRPVDSFCSPSIASSHRSTVLTSSDQDRLPVPIFAANPNLDVTSLRFRPLNFLKGKGKRNLRTVVVAVSLALLLWRRSPSVANASIFSTPTEISRPKQHSEGAKIVLEPGDPAMSEVELPTPSKVFLAALALTDLFVIARHVKRERDEKKQDLRVEAHDSELKSKTDVAKEVNKVLGGLSSDLQVDESFVAPTKKEYKGSSKKDAAVAKPIASTDDIPLRQSGGDSSTMGSDLLVSDVRSGDKIYGMPPVGVEAFSSLAQEEVQTIPAQTTLEKASEIDLPVIKGSPENEMAITEELQSVLESKEKADLLPVQNEPKHEKKELLEGAKKIRNRFSALSEEERLAAKYAAIENLSDRAYQIVLDLGL